MEDILNKVKHIIATRFSVDESSLSENTRFVEDLNADSLDTVEMMMQFEDEFEIEIPDSSAEKIVTVGDVVEYISKRKQEAA